MSMSPSPEVTGTAISPSANNSGAEAHSPCPNANTVNERSPSPVSDAARAHSSSPAGDAMTEKAPPSSEDVESPCSPRPPSLTENLASGLLQAVAESRHLDLSANDTTIDPEKSAGTNSIPEGEDANIVSWDGDDDPENPYNWPTWRKVINCSLLAVLTFITPLASSIFAPGVPKLMEEFHASSDVLAGFVVSVYVLGFAIGPLLMAPMSEIYGRSIVYHICNVGYVAFLIGCALAPSLNSLIVFRFFAGFFGSAPLTNGNGSIVDMIPQESRAAAVSAVSLGPLVGPIIGPIAGGFLSDAKGWRWTFWVLVIISGVVAIMMLLFLRETYAPVLLERKTKILRKQTGNKLLRSKLDTGLSPRDHFKRSIVRPCRLLIFSPICFIFAIYMAVVYGYLYLLFTSVTEVFQQYYHFATSIVGLVYLGLGIGSLIGMVWFSVLSDRAVKRAIAASGGEGPADPEVRLTMLPVGAIFLPAGFFIYGWTAEYHKHWIAPILGMTVIGVGNLLCFMSIAMYLVDAFTIFAASALAANTVVRSTAGAVLPLAGLSMYRTLGIGWGNSLLAFIALALLPIPFLFLRYGERLRKRFEIKDL